MAFDQDRVFVISAVLSAIILAVSTTPTYKVGVGISDVTGPAYGMNMMGYASLDQDTEGIHLRLYSRAFITCNLNDTNCHVFVSADIGMGTTHVKSRVIDNLKDTYGDRYTEKNVAITGTHTHSGPGMYIQYSLYTFTGLPDQFNRRSVDMLVEGLTQSIINAHDNLQEGNIFYNKGELRDVNVNRSPTAYLYNPEEERARYTDDVDKEMTILKFASESGVDLGMICWFPVHPVSMEITNQLISSDNKGYASYLFEKEMNPDSSMGQGSFVAAFANPNHGDTTPHVNGTMCLDTGEQCEPMTSTCDGQAVNCRGSGPGNDMFENTKITGERLYAKAKELYDDVASHVNITGPVSYVHQYVNMSDVTVTVNGEEVKTCSPALGYSFGGGTTDGGGISGLTQGMVENSDLWDSIIGVLFNDYKETQECHRPKPVLLPASDYFNITGLEAIGKILENLMPPPLVPEIVETQLFRIGPFVIMPGPGEFTTMSGRRLMEAVTQKLIDNGMGTDTITMITSLSNTYTNYIATFEEYKAQRYEGASTMYGPYTLDAYLQQYTTLAEYLALGTDVDDPGPAPAIRPLDKDAERAEGDTVPEGRRFGDVIMKVDPKYRQGAVVEAMFLSADPTRGSIRSLGTSFMSVERLSGADWSEVATDADWSTRVSWTQQRSQSQATVRWEIPIDAELGTYRLVNKGLQKAALFNTYESFIGETDPFFIVDKDYVRT